MSDMVGNLEFCSSYAKAHMPFLVNVLIKLSIIQHQKPINNMRI